MTAPRSCSPTIVPISQDQSPFLWRGVNVTRFRTSLFPHLILFVPAFSRPAQCIEDRNFSGSALNAVRFVVSVPAFSVALFVHVPSSVL